MAFSINNNGTSIQLGTSNPGGLGVAAYAPNRKLIQWNLPTRGLVQMYINPSSMSIQERKLTKEVRTKGGYNVQYWGEALPEIDITGSTGSGGIEGINVLRDVYRQEQLAFTDIMSSLNSGFLSNLFQTLIGTTQALSTNPLANPASTGAAPITSASSFFGSVVSAVGNVANVLDSVGRAISSDQQQLIPTLANLATSVELWYDGKIYRGFFVDFRTEESAEALGMLKYQIKFKVTRQAGMRHNDFAWNRSVANGPANSDVVPLSYGALTNARVPTTTASSPAAGTATAPNVSRRSSIIGG